MNRILQDDEEIKIVEPHPSSIEGRMYIIINRIQIVTRWPFNRIYIAIGNFIRENLKKNTSENDHLILIASLRCLWDGIVPEKQDSNEGEIASL